MNPMKAYAVEKIRDAHLLVNSLSSRMLNVNPVLLDYLKQFDFREVIYRKIQACNFNLDNLSSYFCKKEKEIIADMFGIDDSVSIFKKAYELEFGDEIPDIPFMRAEDIHTLKRTK